MLRAGSRRWPPKYETLKDALVGKKVNKKTNRLANHYKCNVCKGEFPASEIQVDHKKPVVDPKIGFVDWDTYIKRLFCERKNLQVLCTDCHKIKSKRERESAKKM